MQFAPKVAGAWALQQAAASSPLDACVLFSSIAALLGGTAQSNYAAANTALDSLGGARRMRGLIASSVQWGPWAAVGMAADASVNARIQASGVGLISLEQGTLALQATLQPSVPGVMSLAVLTWSKFLSLLPEVPPLMVDYASRRGKAVTGGPRGEVKEVTLEAIQETLKSTTGAEVDPDAPLMESGLDSLGAVELGNQLQAQSGLVLPSTLIFDYPTARQLAGYFRRQRDGNSVIGNATPIGLAPEAATANLTAHVKAYGLSANLPLGIIKPSQLKQIAACSGDAVGEVPLVRWSLEADDALGVIGKRVRYGGFLRDVELFDNARFNISPSEAAAMDPQQRLLMEYGYEAFHCAGLNKSGP